MKKIKVVQIGVGHDHAWMIYDSIINQPEVFDVVGLVIPDSEKEIYKEEIESKFIAQGKAKEITLDEALNYPDLDGVIVETEEKNLTKYALMAAEKGLAIHMDKPGGWDSDEFTRLISLVKEKDLPFTTGYMYRFNPCVKKALQKLKNGELGEIFSVEAQMNCEHTKDKRAWLGQFPGGMMFFLGCHLVDLVYQLQGKPQEIIPYNTSTGDVAADDLGFAVWKYENGVSFIKTCAREAGGFMRRQLVICGTKGTIEINPIEAYDFSTGDRNDTYVVEREVDATLNFIADSSRVRHENYNRYDSMMKNFAEIVCGKENPYSYDYELELYKLVLKTCGM